MAGLGILLILYGFGSALMWQFDYYLGIFAWANDMQPAFGIVLGLVGVGVLVAAFLMNKRKNDQVASGSTWGQPGQPGQPGQFGGPQTGTQNAPGQFGGLQTGAQGVPPQGGGQFGPPPSAQNPPPQAQQPPQFGQQNPEQRP